jgi:hypothetical protein
LGRNLDTCSAFEHVIGEDDVDRACLEGRECFFSVACRDNAKATLFQNPLPKIERHSVVIDAKNNWFMRPAKYASVHRKKRSEDN